jgi:hypothetical protein
MLPKPSYNLPRYCWNQSFWIVGFLGRSPNVNSSWCREKREGWLIWPYHARVSSFLLTRFIVVTSSFTHQSITFSNQKLSIAALPWILDLWSSCHVGQLSWTGSSRWLFSFVALSHVLQYCGFSEQSFSMCGDLFLSLLIFATVPLLWCCLPMIHVCRHNLRKRRSRYT